MSICLLEEAAQANKAASTLMTKQDFVAAKKTVKRAQALLEVASVHYPSSKTSKELHDNMFRTRRQQANMLRICKANLGPSPDTASAPVRPPCLNKCD